MHHGGEDAGHHDVKNRANHQRSDDADRQVALRIDRFLCRGGNGVEAYIGEEDERGAGQDTAHAEMRLAGGVRDLRSDEWIPIRRVDVRRGNRDEDEDRGKLTNNVPALKPAGYVSAAESSHDNNK